MFKDASLTQNGYFLKVIVLISAADQGRNKENVFATYITKKLIYIADNSKI